MLLLYFKDLTGEHYFYQYVNIFHNYLKVTSKRVWLPKGGKQNYYL